MAKCHKEFLKHNVNKFGVFKALTLCVARDPTNHLGKGRQSQVAREPKGRVPLPGWFNVFYVILVGFQREDISSSALHCNSVLYNILTVSVENAVENEEAICPSQAKAMQSHHLIWFICAYCVTQSTVLCNAGYCIV